MTTATSAETTMRWTKSRLSSSFSRWVRGRSLDALMNLVVRRQAAGSPTSGGRQAPTVSRMSWLRPGANCVR